MVHQREQVEFENEAEELEEIYVHVAQLGSPVTTVALHYGATVADALTAANKTQDGKSLMVNGSTAAANTVLEDGDRVTLAQTKIKGGK